MQFLSVVQKRLCACNVGVAQTEKLRGARPPVPTHMFRDTRLLEKVDRGFVGAPYHRTGFNCVVSICLFLATLRI